MSKYTLILPLLIISLCHSVNLYAGPADGTIPILLEEEGVPSESSPNRSINQVPIECAYCPSTSFVLTVFHPSLSCTANVEILNQSTGAYFQTIINTNQGSFSFPIPGLADEYEIIISLSNGHIYSGSFVVGDSDAFSVDVLPS